MPLPSAASAAAYLQAGNDLARQDHWSEAVDAYTRAIELDPTLAEAFVMRGGGYFYLGDSDLALADFNKAIELDPELALGFSSRGYAYLFLGRFDLAIADLTRAIELDPTQWKEYAYRGAAKAKGGDTAGATTDFDRALALATDADAVSAIKSLRCAVGLVCE